MAGNPYFNDPTLANAAASIASLFAPPSAQEQAAYAQLADLKAQRDAAAQDFSTIEQMLGPDMAALFRQGGSGVLSGIGDFNLSRAAAALPPGADLSALDALYMGAGNSFGGTAGGVREGFADAQERARIAAAAEIQKTVLDNQGLMDRQLAEPVLVNQNQTGFMPQGTAAATGLPSILQGQQSVGPGETIIGADGVTTMGAPTVDTVRGAGLQDFLNSGDASDQAIWAAIMGESDPVTLGGTATTPGEIRDTAGNLLGAAPFAPSETEVAGNILANSPPVVQQTRALGGTPLVPVVGNGGAPTYGYAGSAAGKEIPQDPMSVDEVMAAVLQGDPDLMMQYALSQIPVEKVGGPDGDTIVRRGDAAGMPAPAGAPSDTVSNYRLPDGTTKLGRVGADGVVVGAQDGVPLPEGSQKFGVQATGTEAGISKSTTTLTEKDVIAVDQTMKTAYTLLDMIQNNPGSQGWVGLIRGTAQDLAQSVNEIGQLLGPEAQQLIMETVNDPEFQAVTGIGYDKTVPAIEVLENTLLYQYGSVLDPNRPSNQTYELARQTIGQNFLGNQEQSVARLTTILEALGTRRDYMYSILQNGLPATAPTGASSAAAAPAAAAPAPTATVTQPFPQAIDPASIPEQFNMTVIPEGQRQAAFDSWPSGQTFLDDVGNIRRKP